MLALAIAWALAAADASGGQIAMSQTEAAPLVWQGAAGRPVARFLALRVVSAEQEGGGFLGLRNSASMPGSLPDARVIRGAAIGADGSDIVSLRVPGGELPPDLSRGARLVLGLVDPGHVIRILVPPSSLPDASLDAWASSQN